MSEPKKWLVEHNYVLYIMDGFGDALEAAKAWGRSHGMDTDSVRVSEVLPGHDVLLSVHVKAEYR